MATADSGDGSMATADPGNGSRFDAGRRQLAGALMAVLLGGVGLLFAAGRAWFTARVERQPPFGPLVAGVSGRALHPALPGLAVVALLIGALVLLTRSRLRRLLGVLLLVTGGWIAWYAVAGIVRTNPGYVGLHDLLGDRLDQAAGVPRLRYHSQWAWLSLLCSLLLVLAALVLVFRSAGWRTGLSSRYDAPVETAASGDPWRQLDRGEDPTIRDG